MDFLLFIDLFLIKTTRGLQSLETKTNPPLKKDKRKKSTQNNPTIKGKVIYFLLNLNINQTKMKKQVFKIIAKLNKKTLPSFTKKQLDISKASKLQLAIIGWRAYVTMNAID